jgi:predicted SprT family Zn-dependent metalloprotease
MQEVKRVELTKEEISLKLEDIKNDFGDIFLEPIGKKDSKIIRFDYSKESDKVGYPARVSCINCGSIIGTMRKVNKKNSNSGYLCKRCGIA